MPRGRNPRYVDQVLQLVKERGYILQIEAAKEFKMKYSTGLENSVKRLVDHNRIKRTKVKIRYKNGNLNEAWILYMPNIDYNLILEYEKELINRPFESPLKTHHCYDKDAETIENLAITETPKNHHNVIDMADYVKVNETELSIKEYHGQRVVTMTDIDNVHNRPSGTARKRFNENKNRFILGEDYYVLKTDEAKVYGIKAPKGLTLITETGYMMIVKSFTDDLAWTVQRQLVNTYFKMKQLAQQNEIKPIPTGQIQSLDIMEMMIKEMKKDRERVDQIEDKLNKIVSILSN